MYSQLKSPLWKKGRIYSPSGPPISNTAARDHFYNESPTINKGDCAFECRDNIWLLD